MSARFVAKKAFAYGVLSFAVSACAKYEPVWVDGKQCVPTAWVTVTDTVYEGMQYAKPTDVAVVYNGAGAHGQDDDGEWKYGGDDDGVDSKPAIGAGYGSDGGYGPSPDKQSGQYDNSDDATSPKDKTGHHGSYNDEHWKGNGSSTYNTGSHGQGQTSNGNDISGHYDNESSYDGDHSDDNGHSWNENGNDDGTDYGHGYASKSGSRVSKDWSQTRPAHISPTKAHNGPGYSFIIADDEEPSHSSAKPSSRPIGSGSPHAPNNSHLSLGSQVAPSSGAIASPSHVGPGSMVSLSSVPVHPAEVSHSVIVHQNSSPASSSSIGSGLPRSNSHHGQSSMNSHHASPSHALSSSGVVHGSILASSRPSSSRSSLSISSRAHNPSSASSSIHSSFVPSSASSSAVVSPSIVPVPLPPCGTLVDGDFQDPAGGPWTFEAQAGENAFPTVDFYAADAAADGGRAASFILRTGYDTARIFQTVTNVQAGVPYTLSYKYRLVNVGVSLTPFADGVGDTVSPVLVVSPEYTPEFSMPFTPTSDTVQIGFIVDFRLDAPQDVQLFLDDITIQTASTTCTPPVVVPPVVLPSCGLVSDGGFQTAEYPYGNPSWGSSVLIASQGTVNIDFHAADATTDGGFALLTTVSGGDDAVQASKQITNLVAGLPYQLDFTFSGRNAGAVLRTEIDGVVLSTITISDDQVGTGYTAITSIPFIPTADTATLALTVTVQQGAQTLQRDLYIDDVKTTLGNGVLCQTPVE